MNSSEPVGGEAERRIRAHLKAMNSPGKRKKAWGSEAGGNEGENYCKPQSIVASRRSSLLAGKYHYLR
jgi:hypothetical protein